MRKSKTKYTYKCDRCNHESLFNDENEQDMVDMSKWKSLNTGFFIFQGDSFDLCPSCYDEFKKQFMSWLPPAFRKALDK